MPYGSTSAVRPAARTCLAGLHLGWRHVVKVEAWVDEGAAIYLRQCNEWMQDDR